MASPASPGAPNKYSGMGNYTPPPRKTQNAGGDWSSYWSVGLSSLQAAASVAAETTTQYAKVGSLFLCVHRYFIHHLLLQTAADRFSETSSTLQERVGQTNWSDTISSLGNSVSETSNTGWSALSNYWQTAKVSHSGGTDFCASGH